MFASDLTLADRGQFIALTTHKNGTDNTVYGMVTTCGHGDPAIELVDGYAYHFNDGDTVEFVTEEVAFKANVDMLLAEILGF